MTAPPVTSKITPVAFGPTAGLFEWARHGKAAAGVGDEDLYGPELSFDLLAHGLDLGEPGDVGHDRQRRSASALDVGPHCGQRRRIPAVHRYLCALLCKEPSDRGANAA